MVGNIGDSRAVLATRDKEDNALLAVQLTVDLKPDLPSMLLSQNLILKVRRSQMKNFRNFFSLSMYYSQVNQRESRNVKVESLHCKTSLR